MQTYKDNGQKTIRNCVTRDCKPQDIVFQEGDQPKNETYFQMKPQGTVG